MLNVLLKANSLRTASYEGSVYDGHDNLDIVSSPAKTVLARGRRRPRRHPEILPKSAVQHQLIQCLDRFTPAIRSTVTNGLISCLKNEVRPARWKWEKRESQYCLFF